ncbi:hypothetical protein M0802_005214 [Mischocyttarus mexicanus]|nr:hypothetical protein M0802_005214 [Mischocyttarus mexicanus]
MHGIIDISGGSSRVKEDEEGMGLDCREENEKEEEEGIIARGKKDRRGSCGARGLPCARKLACASEDESSWLLPNFLAPFQKSAKFELELNKRAIGVVRSQEEPRRGATGMSPDELSSCLPATPIFSYRVTATLSIPVYDLSEQRKNAALTAYDFSEPFVTFYWEKENLPKGEEEPDPSVRVLLEKAHGHFTVLQ